MLALSLDGMMWTIFNSSIKVIQQLVYHRACINTGVFCKCLRRHASIWRRTKHNNTKHTNGRPHLEGPKLLVPRDVLCNIFVRNAADV